mmetsp:Transcript_13358/g.17616  ORF Transcript_13358/g.17616 Transcript_13358/m.17616 type:complete len:266 (+) Transcript_13358:661-1458(+)
MRARPHLCLFQKGTKMLKLHPRPLSQPPPLQTPPLKARRESLFPLRTSSPMPHRRFSSALWVWTAIPLRTIPASPPKCQNHHNNQQQMRTNLNDHWLTGWAQMVLEVRMITVGATAEVAMEGVTVTEEIAQGSEVAVGNGRPMEIAGTAVTETGVIEKGEDIGTGIDGAGPTETGGTGMTEVDTTGEVGTHMEEGMIRGKIGQKTQDLRFLGIPDGLKMRPRWLKIQGQKWKIPLYLGNNLTQHRLQKNRHQLTLSKKPSTKKFY